MALFSRYIHLALTSILRCSRDSTIRPIQPRSVITWTAFASHLDFTSGLLLISPPNSVRNYLLRLTMTDDISGKRSIPSWQQPQNTTPESSASDQPSQSSNDNSTATLVEQAAKFLQDKSIRDASTTQKVSFLESKGLQKDVIEGLLGVSRNAEASGNSNDTSATESSPTDTTTTSTTSTSEKNETLPETSEDAPSKSHASTTSSPPSTTATQSSSQPSSQPRDIPPIITYPEFLVKQSKPPPLVTLNSILYTIYGSMGLGASIYGASEYLVKPMLANLTSARHDLSQTAQENLRQLNEKLEQTVSKIPPELASRQANETADSDDDADSVTSDPTELFHRDVATQTNPQDVTSSKETSAGEAEKEPTPTETVNSHLKRLETINSHLREFSDTENESTAADDTVRGSLRDLHYYLDGLTYSNPSYGSISGYGTWSSPGTDSSRSLQTGVEKGEEDAMASFRTEIRGVKGALLSAKNFPAGRGARIGSSFSGR